MSMTIKLEPSAGCSIGSAFDKAKKVSIILGLTAEFDFNGVTCLVYEASDKDKFIQSYHNAIKSDDKYKLAS